MRQSIGPGILGGGKGKQNAKGQPDEILSTSWLAL